MLGGHVLLTSLAITAGSPAEAAILTVGSTADYPTVGAALADALAGDRIEISPGVYPESILVSQDLEIVGTGGAAATTLGAPGVAPAVTVQGGTLTVSGLTLDPAAERGIDVLAGAVLVADDLVVSDHGGGLDGAAIRVTDGALVLTNGVFERNAGGDGGALALERTAATVGSCRFADGSATDGAAIRARGGTLLVLDSEFVGNDSDDHAALATFGGAVVEVEGSTFDGNLGSLGGAVYVEEGSLAIRGSVLTGNGSTGWAAGCTPRTPTS